MTSSNKTKQECYVIKKDAVKAFLDSLSDYTLHAPVREDETILFKEIKNTDDIIYDFSNAVKAPKDVVMPQTETMLTITKGGKDSLVVEEPESPDKSVVFGIRPCDAKGIALLDQIFYEDKQDTYYVQRRENTTIIALACNDPHRNCFCTSVGGAPNGKAGCDLLFTDIGDAYFVEVVTSKGKKLITNKKLFKSISEADKKAKNAAHKEATRKLGDALDLKNFPEKLEKMFGEEFWEKYALKCIGCGACAYMCPTCYCFDINDIDYKDVVKRVRTWDSCQFGNYTMHTSGHNPRPNKVNRVRNRVLHKFKYHVDNYNEIKCVGCGRCTTHCPVNMNLKAIIKELAEKEL